MKDILLILDGASDAPAPALGGLTPLEAARTPGLDALAACGRLGRVRTAVPGLPVDSLVCILGLLGYDPARFAPLGRAAFEAVGRGVPLGPDDLALRCNLVSVTPEGRLGDSTGGMPDDAEAGKMLSALRLPNAVLPDAELSEAAWELHPGQSYRNLLVLRGEGALAASLRCAEPHMRLGEPVGRLMPFGVTPRGAELAARLGRFMEESRERLAATSRMVWLWSPATLTALPPFRLPGGPRGKGCVIAALDFMRGLARAAGLASIDVPGASGALDTDFAAKGRAALRALDDFDFVLIHVNAADEAAHQRDPKAKAEAIERTDALLIQPLFAALRARYPQYPQYPGGPGDLGGPGAFRFAVCADHATLCADGKHGEMPPPFLVCTGAAAQGTATTGPPVRFTERATLDIAPLPAAAFLGDVFPAK